MNEGEPFSYQHLSRIGRSVAERIAPRNIALLNSSEGARWGTISSELCQLSEKQQRQFLDEFFGPQGANFPSGKHLARYFFEIVNTSWFGTHEISSPKWEDQMVADHLTALNLSLDETRLFQQDWRLALSNLNMAMKQAARDSRRYEALQAAGRYVSGVLDDEFYQAQKAGVLTKERAYLIDSLIAGEAEWIVVEDLMAERGYNHGNPYEPLRGLCQQGVLPLGIRKGRFAISYVPLLKAA